MSKEYWDNRWKEKETGWDIGYPSTPLVNIIDSIEEKSARILIPGCGSGYEAMYAFKNGFTNVFVIEISPSAVERFKTLHPEFPTNQIFCEDFFTHHGNYDVILEQTFFCAIDPSERDHYVMKMADLLLPGGKLMGVLFDFPLEQGPPFGGDAQEYKKRFKNHFEIELLEPCMTSIAPRQGRELSVSFRRKSN